MYIYCIIHVQYNVFIILHITDPTGTSTGVSYIGATTLYIIILHFIVYIFTYEKSYIWGFDWM